MGIFYCLLAAALLPSPALIEKLPPEYRPLVQNLQLTAKEQKAWVSLEPEDLKHQVLIALASEPSAADFVIAHLANESRDTVEKVLKVIAYETFWIARPGTAEQLARLGQASADDDLMLDYLDAARRLEVHALRQVLDARLAATPGSAPEHASLAQADDDWIALSRGSNLPAFLRKAPPLFTVVPADQPIRVIGIGDFGTGSSAQRGVASSIQTMSAQKRFDFGITFGDNFYPSGMTSPSDPRWRDWWESLYAPLGTKFYPTFGNHEWYSPDGGVSEIVYRSDSWSMPAEFYTFLAGPVQFFAVDTTEISAVQADWLGQAIAASTAHWKIVYGHHPVFAPEKTAKSLAEQRYEQEHLWPIIRGKVDAYICGHQHAMAQLAPREGVRLYMSGGGGAPLSAVDAAVNRTQFAESTFGFLTLEASASQMKIGIYDAKGSVIDSDSFTK